jgi:hypothetical protein
VSDGSAAAATEVVPPEREEQSPRPWLALVAAVVLLAIGGGLWWLWPEDPSGDTQVPGSGAIGSALTPEGAGSVGPAADDAAVLIDPSASPGSSLPPQLPKDVRQGALLVRTDIPRQDLISLSYTVRVTISNVGDVTGSWRSVGLRLSGLNLVVKPDGSVVTYEFRAPAHCLVPADVVALAPGESMTIDVSVTGALGGVQSARLDEAPCPT